MGYQIHFNLILDHHWLVSQNYQFNWHIWTSSVFWWWPVWKQILQIKWLYGLSFNESQARWMWKSQHGWTKVVIKIMTTMKNPWTWAILQRSPLSQPSLGPTWWALDCCDLWGPHQLEEQGWVVQQPEHCSSCFCLPPPWWRPWWRWC